MNLGIKRLGFLLEKDQKRKLIILSFFLLISMLFETIFLSFLPKAIKSFTDDNFIQYVVSLFGLNSSKHVLVLIGLIALIFFLIKSILLIVLTYKQNQFVYGLVSNLTTRVYKYYLFQDMNFHSKIDVALMLRNIQVEMSMISSYLNALITFFIESFLMLTVFMVLVIIEPFATLFFGSVFLIVTILLSYFTKNIITAWGERRQIVDQNINQIALEGLSNIREIFLYNVQTYFITNFNNNVSERANIFSKHSTLSNIPRIYMEFISILSLSFLIIFFLIRGDSLIVITSLMAVYVTSAFRLLPSVNRIISSMQSLNYYKPSLIVIHNLLKNNNHKENKNNCIENTRINNVKLVDASYSIENKLILNQINLSISRGDILLIKGPSGIGKSTLLNILSGLYSLKSGKLLINESNFNKINRTVFYSKIGFISQNNILIDDTVLNNIIFGRNFYDENLLNEVVEEFKLKKQFLNKKVGEGGKNISGGEKQKIAIARAIIGDPDLLILDEAFNALDFKSKKIISDYLKNKFHDKIIVFITHDFFENDFFNKVFEFDSSGKSSIYEL